MSLHNSCVPAEVARLTVDHMSYNTSSLASYNLSGSEKIMIMSVTKKHNLSNYKETDSY